MKEPENNAAANTRSRWIGKKGIKLIPASPGGHGGLFSFGPERVREEFISSERIRDCCDSVWGADAHATVRLDAGYLPGDAVFACVDDAPVFFERARLHRSRVVLVTADGDRPADRETLRWMPPQVARWFSTNAVERHPSLSALPLGLANPSCGITLKADQIAGRLGPNEGRKGWLYVNFRTETNPSVRGPIQAHFEALSRESWVTFERPASPGDVGKFHERMISHRFILCPPGNGVDTHRLWEALYCKTIPVVLRSTAMEDFSDLPIVLVDDYRLITRDFLAEQSERLNAARLNEERLFLPWWEARIRRATDRLAHSGTKMPPGEFARVSLRYLLGMMRRRTSGRVTEIKRRGRYIK